MPVVAQILKDTSISKKIYINGDSLKETEYFLDIQIEDPLYSGLKKNAKLNLLHRDICDDRDYDSPQKALVLLKQTDKQNYDIHYISCLFEAKDEEPHCDSSYSTQHWFPIYEYLQWIKNQQGEQSYIYNDEYRIVANFKNKKLDGDFFIYNRINQLVLKAAFKKGKTVGIWQYYQKSFYVPLENENSDLAPFDFDNTWNYTTFKMPEKKAQRAIYDFIRPIDSTQLVYDSTRNYWVHRDFIAVKNKNK